MAVLFTIGTTQKRQSETALYSMFFCSDGSGHLIGTKAAGAYTNGLVRSVHDSLDLSDVGLPGSAGPAVGVGYVVSEGNSLSAYTAFCHFNTSKSVSRIRFLTSEGYYITKFCKLQYVT